MYLEQLETKDLSQEQEREINHVAALGFGQDHVAMLDDTINHIHSADLIHIDYSERGMRGFAMYTACLWRRFV